MTKVMLATVVLFGSLPLLLGSGTDAATQQLLVTAKQQASLFHDQTSPIQLDVDFLAQMNVPTQGHLTLKWQANDRWWRRVVMGDFEQIEIRNGDRQYTSRNLSFTPPRIGELIRLLQFAEGSEKLLAKKRKERTSNGIEMVCIRVEGPIKGSAHDVCVNSVSRDILSDEWNGLPDERRMEQYSDYFDFGVHRYPRKLQLLVNGITVITANVDSLTTADFDQALLVAPRGAIERRQCADMKTAVPVRTPDPMYPTPARDNKLMGDTTVAMTVQADGSVSDVRLAGSATRSMDDATVRTLKSWRFKPAMCGSEPVVSDLEVVVSFRLY